LQDSVGTTEKYEPNLSDEDKQKILKDLKEIATHPLRMVGLIILSVSGMQEVGEEKKRKIKL
jgi:hypothetical protein